MIHDLFLRRYPNQIYWGDRPTPAMHRLFTQVAHIVFSDLAPALKLDQSFFKAVHDALARELGLGRLVDAPTYDAICGEYLTESYDLWKDRHGTADTFLKARLSLVELLFRAMEERVSSRRAAAAPRPTLLSRSPSPAPTNDGSDEAVSAAVRELNNRLRQAGMGLHYHNGLIQFAQDELTQERAAEPCWTILRDVKWANVDRELKEAIDHADGGRPDAAFHAAKALESTIKIISDDQGWTSGKERGAANYIDNLVSQKNGRFLEPWEGEMLKAFFVHVRNPHGHGAGSQPPPALTDPQTTWAIEATMSWIKSLVRRL